MRRATLEAGGAAPQAAGRSRWSCRRLGLGVLVGDWGEHPAGGVPTLQVVLLQVAGDRCPRLGPGGEARPAEQLELQGVPGATTLRSCPWRIKGASRRSSVWRVGRGYTIYKCTQPRGETDSLRRRAGNAEG